MKLFNTIFKGKNESKPSNETKINWIPLTSIDQLETIKEQSKQEVVFIFKHSTRCGISRMVIKQFENLFDETSKNLKVYYLDLLNYREISNEISAVFQVMHQSPQLLVIRNTHTVFHASHYDITEVALVKYQ